MIDGDGGDKGVVVWEASGEIEVGKEQLAPAVAPSPPPIHSCVRVSCLAAVAPSSGKQWPNSSRLQRVGGAL